MNKKGGIFTARKKKPSRKYIPRNEFRYNNSPEANGHPHYVFGEKGNRYLSLGITSHPKKEYPYYPLKQSPNPNNPSSNYIQKRVFNTKKKYYGPRKNGWFWTKEDMHTVRHIIKNYKKKK